MIKKAKDIRPGDVVEGKRVIAIMPSYNDGNKLVLYHSIYNTSTGYALFPDQEIWVDDEPDGEPHAATSEVVEMDKTWAIRLSSIDTIGAVQLRRHCSEPVFYFPIVCNGETFTIEHEDDEVIKRWQSELVQAFVATQ